MESYKRDLDDNDPNDKAFKNFLNSAFKMSGKPEKKDLFDEELQEKLIKEATEGAIETSSSILSLLSFGFITFLMYKEVLDKDKERSLSLVKQAIDMMRKEITSYSSNTEIADNIKKDPLMALTMGDEIDDFNKKCNDLIIETFLNKFKEIEDHLISFLTELIDHGLILFNHFGFRNERCVTNHCVDTL